MDLKITYPLDDLSLSFDKDNCPILHALKVIGRKWKLPILWFLHERRIMRYNELRRRITGITNIMLTKSLRELESDGLVCRRVIDDVPPKVEYSLTSLGRELMPTLNDLYRWGEKQLAIKSESFNEMRFENQRDEIHDRRANYDCRTCRRI